MRLSDIQGERTLDVIADIIDPIANIAEDEAAAALFKREKLPEGADVKKYLLNRVRKSVPSLLKDHKRDLIAIFAAIDGTSEEEYAETLNLAKLMKDSAELLTDEAFAVFFTSSGGSSGDVSEVTEGHAE